MKIVNGGTTILELETLVMKIEYKGEIFDPDQAVNICVTWEAGEAFKHVVAGISDAQGP